MRFHALFSVFFSLSHYLCVFLIRMTQNFHLPLPAPVKFRMKFTRPNPTDCSNQITCPCWRCICPSSPRNHDILQLTTISDKSHNTLVNNDYHGNGNHANRTASGVRASSAVRVSIEQDQQFFVQRIVRHCKVINTKSTPNITTQQRREFFEYHNIVKII